MDLTGAVIYDEFGSNVIIFNTTFVNNSATKYSTDDCYSSSIGGIVRISKSYMSIWKIYIIANSCKIVEEWQSS